jgi:WD40 repeat protein
MGEEEAVAEENGGLKVESGEQKSSWPTMRFDVSPYRTHHFSKQFRTARNPNNFLKGLKWSPDGSCFLASSEDNTLSLFHLPQDGGDSNGYGVPVPEEDSYGASLLVNEGESVYDFCWYPYMSVSDPLTCVFATSTRDHPIHLWDSTSGELRCTYRAYDAMDEITAAFSVGFNPDGTKIFAGYNSSIRVFDLHRPGRDFRQYSTLQKNKEGQAGILSTLAFSPTNSGMLAVGSYGQTTGIYREDNMELLYVLHGQEGGVTHVQFSKDGNYLYTGGRKVTYCYKHFTL